MSRRKQSNPKPAKREIADFDQVVSELNLPLDRVYLRKFGEECLVLAKEHLKAGTVLGTYKCNIRELTDGEEDDKNILKVNRSDNGTQNQVMIDNEGHWLKLMRSAILPTDANICLRISGRELVCKVTKDVNKEVELKVTYRIDDQTAKFDHERTQVKRERSPTLELCQEDSNDRYSEDLGMSPKVTSSPVQKSVLDSISERVLDNSGEMLVKKSASVERDTPESKKPRNDYSGDENDCDVEIDVSSSTVHRSPSSGERHEERTNSLPSRGSNKSSDHETSPHSRVHTEDDRIYKCHLCPYISVEKYAIDKHIQSHRAPPSKKVSSSLTNAKSFCDACNIQFMSIDTYQVHKQFYCKSRHEKDEAFMSSSVLESTNDLSANAIKPGPETVIIRSGGNGALTSSMIQPQAIYAAISTNPLILLPCSLVNGQRLVPHGGVVPTGGPGIVLQSGIGCPTIVEKSTSVKLKDEGPPSRKTSHPIMNFNSDSLDRSMSGSSSLRKRKMSEGDVLNLKKSRNNETINVVDSEMHEKDTEPEDPDTPLDLSFKKKGQSPSGVPVQNRKHSIPSVECPSPSYHNTSDSGSPNRPSILHSRITISPCSYSNDSQPCYTSTVPVPVPRLSKGMSERLSPLSSSIQGDTSGDKASSRQGMLQPKLLKQGNNICEECQIVFFKYDNYLAHKKHYCAYRRQQLSALAAAAAAAAASNQENSSDDNNSENSGQNKPTGGYHSDEPVNAVIRRIEHPVEQFRSVITKSSQSVYCCDSCGVKFSTPDNLNAHQTYYCIKRADSAMSKVSAGRGDNSNSPKSLESPFTGPEEWKCNYCEATCSSYDTIRRHLLTHSELRGFRCTLCGYKGNTMRGMRSHACEHLTDGSTSIEEFVSKNIVAESGMIPIMPQMDPSDEDSEHSRDSKRERSYSDRIKDRSILKKETVAMDHSQISESSNSPGIVENRKESGPILNSPIKSESGDSGNLDMNGNSQQDSVNPMAFCDVVIKTENEQSSSADDSSHDGPSGSYIKYEPAPEYESDEKPCDLSKSPPANTTSVIRCAYEPGKDNTERFTPLQSTKRKGKSQSKQNSESKYCKSCDISFSHLSNFLAHKKFYCVSRVIQNCHQETATVQ